MRRRYIVEFIEWDERKGELIGVLKNKVFVSGCDKDYRFDRHD